VGIPGEARRRVIILLIGQSQRVFEDLKLRVGKAKRVTDETVTLFCCIDAPL
jgi:hypothetical protein